MKVRKEDIPLLKAFIQRECQDFKNYNPLDYTAEHMLESIQAQLKGLGVAGDWLEFNSLGNTGTVIRQLRLEAAPFKTGKNVSINFNNEQLGEAIEVYYKGDLDDYDY